VTTALAFLFGAMAGVTLCVVLLASRSPPAAGMTRRPQRHTIAAVRIYDANDTDETDA
jgi:hypothetical protein